MFLIRVGYKRSICSRFGGWKWSSFTLGESEQVLLQLILLMLICCSPWREVTAGSATAPPSLSSSFIFSISWARSLQLLDEGDQLLPTLSRLEVVKLTWVPGQPLRFSLCSWVPALPHFISIFTSWLVALRTLSSSIRNKDDRLTDCVTCSHNCIRPALCNKSLIIDKYIWLLLVLLLSLNPDWYKCLVCVRHWYKPTAITHPIHTLVLWGRPGQAQRIRNLPKVMQLLSG